MNGSHVTSKNLHYCATAQLENIWCLGLWFCTLPQNVCFFTVILECVPHEGCKVLKRKRPDTPRGVGCPCFWLRVQDVQEMQVNKKQYNQKFWFYSLWSQWLDFGSQWLDLDWSKYPVSASFLHLISDLKLWHFSFLQASLQSLTAWKSTHFFDLPKAGSIQWKWG